MKAILILTDSVNRRFLNCYGATEPAVTPNIDRPAQRGTGFENHIGQYSPAQYERLGL